MAEPANQVSPLRPSSQASQATRLGNPSFRKLILSQPNPAAVDLQQKHDRGLVRFARELSIHSRPDVDQAQRIWAKHLVLSGAKVSGWTYTFPDEPRPRYRIAKSRVLKQVREGRQWKTIRSWELVRGAADLLRRASERTVADTESSVYAASRSNPVDEVPIDTSAPTRDMVAFADVLQASPIPGRLSADEVLAWFDDSGTVWFGFRARSTLSMQLAVDFLSDPERKGKGFRPPKWSDLFPSLRGSSNGDRRLDYLHEYEELIASMGIHSSRRGTTPGSLRGVPDVP